MKIKSSLGNEAEDRTGVHQGKVTTDNFDFRRVLKKSAWLFFFILLVFYYIGCNILTKPFLGDFLKFTFFI
ncbi:hypothetical protein FH691_06090 [Streptococcus suis]|nr:hypothetical protein FH691_06090 [Streptococcus suis]